MFIIICARVSSPLSFLPFFPHLCLVVVCIRFYLIVSISSVSQVQIMKLQEKEEKARWLRLRARSSRLASRLAVVTLLQYIGGGSSVRKKRVEIVMADMFPRSHA